MIEDEEQPQLLNTIGEYPTEEVGTIEEDIYVIGVESLNGKAGDLTLKSINGEDLVGTGNIALATAAQMQAETQAREQADAAETLARQQADQALQNTKQDNLTTAQLAAVNSGIDSTKVGQIATNATNITSLQNTKQDNLTQTQLNAVNSGIDQSKVAQIETNRQNIATNAGDIDTIESKIPGAATSTNQLTDKNYVDNAIATNTADYISDNGQPFQSLADLEAYSGPLTNNDYAFVVSTDSAGNLLYTRYKYNSTAEQWAEEYTIANPTFTSTQWAAIDSGVTATDVAQIGTNKSDITGLQNSKQDNLSSTQLDAVNSGIDATKVTQIATNTGDIATLQSGKQDKLVAGTNIQIAADGKTISATDTIYTAGSGLNLAGTEFSVDTATIQPKLTAGSNITITGNEISATDTTYTAGAGLTLTGTEFSVNDPAPSGFWTGNATESGTGTSITLNNALATTPKDLGLDGNTEQISYTGKNLFSVSFQSSGTIQPSDDNAYTLTKPTTRTARFDFPTALPAGTYTLSMEVETLSNTSGLRISPQPTGQGITPIADITTTGSVSRTITVPSGVAMASLYWYIPNNDDDGATISVKNVQLELSSTASAYEPYVGGVASPNPSYPQDINVVTGRQVVRVSGKNLWGGFTNSFSSSPYGISYITNPDGTIDVSSGTVDGGTSYSMGSNNARDNKILVVLPAGSYTISGSVGNIGVSVIKSENGAGIADSTNGAKASFVLSQETSVFVRVQILNGVNVSATTIRPMLEKGVTASDYEPFKGGTYEINLGKNILPIDSASRTSNDVTSTGYPATGKAVLNGTASSAAAQALYLDRIIQIKSGVTYTLSANNPVADSNVKLRLYAGGTSYPYEVSLSTVNASTTFTADADYMVRPQWRVASGASLTDFEFYPQLELGSTATTFAPYFTPLELCKIGTYQDYIYKSNGNWYKHVEVEKVVLDGSNDENWSIANTGTVNFYYRTDQNIAPGALLVSNGLISNYESYGEINNSNTKSGVAIDGAYRVRLRYGTEMSVASWQSQLGTTNMIVYYLLATPTDTQITNAGLVAQLEALASAKLATGQNTIISSTPRPNLDAILTIDVFENNWNGLSQAMLGA